MNFLPIVGELDTGTSDFGHSYSRYGLRFRFIYVMSVDSVNAFIDVSSILALIWLAMCLCRLSMDISSLVVGP